MLNTFLPILKQWWRHLLLFTIISGYSLTATAQELVSINQARLDSGNGASALMDRSIEARFSPGKISANGRYLVFQSVASDLAVTQTGSNQADSNGAYDVFVRDLQTRTTRLVSINITGNDSGKDRGGNKPYAANPVISADGRYVVFESSCDTLVNNDTNNLKAKPPANVVDIFVRDLVAGTTTLVSINHLGTESSNSYSYRPVISMNGNVAAFESISTDLVVNDTNGGLLDVFARDLLNGTTTLLSVNHDGTGSGNARSHEPVLSDDGQFAVFLSDASDLVLNDTNRSGDVFVRNLQSGNTTLVSVNLAGTDSGNGSSESAAISADGRYVVFSSKASDLVPNDTNGAQDVFVRDLQSGTTTLISANRAGVSGNNLSGDLYRKPAISASNQFIAFVSRASDLVPNDTNYAEDVFVRDLTNGTTTLVSVNRAGTSGNDLSGDPIISADGRFVVFVSFATDLVPNTTTRVQNVYVRDLQLGVTTLLSDNGSGTNGNAPSGNPVISADGSVVAFDSRASDLIDTAISDTNGTFDVYVSDLP